MTWKKSQKSGKFKPPSKVNPVWDLYRDGITFSMLSRFLVCRERFRLSSVEGWTEGSIRNVLEFGNVFHFCMEQTIKGLPVTSIDRWLADYEKKRKNIKGDDREQLELLLGTIRVMFPLYLKFWAKADTNKVYVAQEQKFCVKHTLPVSKRTIQLRGRWDALFRAPSRSSGNQHALWLQENKTKSNIDEEGLQGGLQYDLQTMLYSYTISREYNEYPTDICYNVIRRPAIRMRVNERLVDYLLRLEEDINSRPTFYFMRWETALSSREIDHWVQHTLNPILEQVVEWWESIKHNPFDPWRLANGEPNLHHYLRPFGVYDGAATGQRGDFFDLVTKQNSFGLFRRDVPFPELVD